MNNTITRIILLGLLAFLILFGIFFFAVLPNETKNGFNRKLISTAPVLIKSVPLDQDISGFAGMAGGNIYLASLSPKVFFSIRSNFNNIDTFVFNIPVSEELSSSFHLQVDSPDIFIYGNNAGKIIHGQINGSKADSIPVPTSVFIRSLKISPQSSILRSFDSPAPRQVFQKINMTDGSLQKQETIIENQDNFGFSSDGKLAYDSASYKLLFVQFFQNKFYCMDTNLNLLYTSKTIDTVQLSSQGFTKIVDDKGEIKLNPAASRKDVNKSCFASNGYLYVLSALRADNEDREIFSKNSVIDIYKTGAGQYSGSFYLPNIDREPVREFIVKRDILFALYKTRMVSYRLPPTAY